MKKLFFYVLAILFSLSSCSTKDSDILEDTSDILANIFEEWGIAIPYRDVSKSKTYHLLEALLDDMSKNLLPPQPVHSSYYPTLSPTELNNYLQDNQEAVALFKRADCKFVLISKYLTNLKADHSLGYNRMRKYNFFEMLLSSNMFLSELNTTEKVQLMVLALERYKYIESFGYENYFLPFTIMISIMLQSNYPPFVEDVEPMLIEQLYCGYGLKSEDYHVTFVDGNFIKEGNIALPGIHVQASDLVIRYAKQYINDNK